MRSKSLDNLISEVYKESSMFLENTLNRQQAIDILKGYGINDSFNLKDPLILNGLQRNLSNKFNPNNGGNADDFKKINAAFETLKNSSGGNQQVNNPEISTYTPGNNQQPNNQQPNNQQPNNQQPNNQQPNNQQPNNQQYLSPDQLRDMRLNPQLRITPDQLNHAREREIDPDKSPKFCTKCGKPVGKGARFCTHCGSPITGINA